MVFSQGNGCFPGPTRLAAAGFLNVDVAHERPGPKKHVTDSNTVRTHIQQWPGHDQVIRSICVCVWVVAPCLLFSAVGRPLSQAAGQTAPAQ